MLHRSRCEKKSVILYQSACRYGVEAHEHGVSDNVAVYLQRSAVEKVAFKDEISSSYQMQRLSSSTG